MDNAKNCEHSDLQLGEREKEMKTQGMKCGSARLNVDGVEREN